PRSSANSSIFCPEDDAVLAIAPPMNAGMMSREHTPSYTARRRWRARPGSDVDDGSLGTRRWNGRLLPLAQCDDKRDATGPRRQHVGDGKEFDDEGRQQEGVEPEKPPHHDCRGGVERLVEGHPTQRAGEQLKSIGRDGRDVRSGDAVSSERRYLQEGGDHSPRVTGRIGGVELSGRLTRLSA